MGPSMVFAAGRGEWAFKGLPDNCVKGKGGMNELAFVVHGYSYTQGDAFGKRRWRAAIFNAFPAARIMWCIARLFRSARAAAGVPVAHLSRSVKNQCWIPRANSQIRQALLTS